MDYTTLGRTGLKVSVMGVGGGGPSQLGRSTLDIRQSIAIVHRALDAGVNFIDTAWTYGTEEIVGAAIKGLKRDELVIATKGHISKQTRAVDVKRSRCPPCPTRMSPG